MIIPKEIDSEEILVRFVFLDHFRKKKVLQEKIFDQDIFLDTRLFGISLQRSTYTSVDFCKSRAKLIDSKVFVGFVVFKKNNYLSACNEFKLIRTNFHSDVEFTPLDESNNYLVNRTIINSDDKGNPSHSDIIYYNPAIEPNESNPKIALRIFSKILYKKSILVLDDSNNDFGSIVNFESLF